MNVYELDFDLDDYRGLDFKSDEDAGRFYSAWKKRRDGEEVTSIPNLSAVGSKHGAAGKHWQSLIFGDVAHFAPGVLALKLHAMESLYELLTGRGVFFSILPEKLGYNGFFVTTTLDALDRERSQLKLFPGGKNISKIITYQLHRDKIRDQSIFYLKDVFPEIFVTNQFVECVEQCGITGFKFNPIWSGPD